MSSEYGDWAVRATGLSKYYELGQSASLQRTARDIAAALTRNPRRPKMFKAVQKASFEIAQGECFTLLGKNGSGKTTLVSMLAGITVPTAGRLEIRGRVLPLLSVGSSFHQELTGRENAELLGALIGLEHDEVREALPEVQHFAEMDDEHMETPVKRFSEGMKARLAFATALRFPADLYIFDEVLTFTDDSFKHKCVEAIRGLSEAGNSIVFISHELQLVRDLCSRGIWMEEGRVRMDASIDELAEAYADAGLEPALKRS